MNFETVPDSGNVHSLAYDPGTQDLQVKFGCKGCKKTGKGKSVSAPEEEQPVCPECKGAGHSTHYAYGGIPPEIYAKIRSEPSLGSALHQYVVRNVKGRRL